jgi:hypothetical protein
MQGHIVEVTPVVEGYRLQLGLEKVHKLEGQKDLPQQGVILRGTGQVFFLLSIC